jgi:hypothetical protein
LGDEEFLLLNILEVTNDLHHAMALDADKNTELSSDSKMSRYRLSFIFQCISGVNKRCLKAHDNSP